MLGNSIIFTIIATNKMSMMTSVVKMASVASIMGSIAAFRFLIGLIFSRGWSGWRVIFPSIIMNSMVMT